MGHPLSEKEAIEKDLEMSARHIVPIDKREDYELARIQGIGDWYKAGYQLVPRFQTGLTMGDIQRMKEEGVAY